MSPHHQALLSDSRCDFIDKHLVPWLSLFVRKAEKYCLFNWEPDYQKQTQGSFSKEEEENEYKVNNWSCCYIMFCSFPRALQKPVSDNSIWMSNQLPA